MSSIAAQYLVADLLGCSPKVASGYLEYVEPNNRIDDEIIVMAGRVAESGITAEIEADCIQRGLAMGLDRRAAVEEAYEILFTAADLVSVNRQAINRIRLAIEAGGELL